MSQIFSLLDMLEGKQTYFDKNAGHFDENCLSPQRSSGYLLYILSLALVLMTKEWLLNHKKY